MATKDSPTITGTASYGVSTKPNPFTVNTTFSITKDPKTSLTNILTVTVNDVPDLTIDLTPEYTGDPPSDIVSFFSSLVVDATGFLSSSAKGYITGLTLHISPLPDVPLDLGGANLSLKPTNMSLSNAGGDLLISGDVEFTSP